MSKTAKSDKIADLNEIVKNVSSEQRLRDWTELTEEVKVLNPILAVALMSDRPELIKVIKAEALTAEQVKHLYNLIAVLMDTNSYLRQHASQLAEFHQGLYSHLKGALTTTANLRQFANFELAYEADDE